VAHVLIPVRNSLLQFSVLRELAEKFACSSLPPLFFNRHCFVFLVFRSLPHLFFIYILFLFLSFITTFLKNCLAYSRLLACLFFMRKLDKEKHCSYWKRGVRKGGRGVGLLCVHRLLPNIVQVPLLFHLPQFSRGSVHFFTFCFTAFQFI
jgi:hypothetical protein